MHWWWDWKITTSLGALPWISRQWIWGTSGAWGCHVADWKQQICGCYSAIHWSNTWIDSSKYYMQFHPLGIAKAIFHTFSVDTCWRNQQVHLKDIDEGALHFCILFIRTLSIVQFIKITTFQRLALSPSSGDKRERAKGRWS
jgi:hypothetical protein